MEKSYSYQEVFLKPRYSEFEHRNADLSVLIGKKRFKLPVVPANMKCVIDIDRAKWMSENDYFYIMHRFNKDPDDAPNADNCEFVRQANEENWKTISVSVGVQEYDKRFLVWCDENDFRIDFITIDIAHGHSILMKNMINAVCEAYQDCHIIAGNVATERAVRDLHDWGADIVKVGIAQGGACTTFGKTGFGSPMFTTIYNCSKIIGLNGSVKDDGQGRGDDRNDPRFAFEYIPIIADGGIRTNGDIAKAIAAGATMVMAGSLFAACKDSPADSLYDTDTFLERKLRWEKMESVRKNLELPKWMENPPPAFEPTHKIYYGSASEYNTHSKHHIEGTRIELPVDRWNYDEKLIEIEEDLQSSVSYAGGDLEGSEWGIRTP